MDASLESRERLDETGGDVGSVAEVPRFMAEWWQRVAICVKMVS
jgi:hypothetical protein